MPLPAQCLMPVFIFFIINQFNRLSASRILRAGSGVVSSKPGLQIRRPATVKGAIGTPEKIDVVQTFTPFCFYNIIR